MQTLLRKYRLIILPAVAVIAVIVIYVIGSRNNEANVADQAAVMASDQEPGTEPIVITQETAKGDGQGSESADGQEPDAMGGQEAAQVSPPPENLKEGMEDAYVAQLQEKLMKLGFMENDEPTQFYGPVTAASVKIFQRQNNLAQDGIAGAETLAAIMSEGAKYYAVSKGVSGSDVKRIQGRLYELGYVPSGDAVNGNFDDITEQAVRKLQEVNQLTVDGKVGSQTLNLLYSDTVKPNFLTYGEKNEVVLKSQNRLKSLGYLTTEPDGNYGDDTMLAVKQFQSRNGLIVDGYLGPSTRAVLEQSDAKSNGLVLGEHGDGVKRVQELLRGYGYLSSGNVTGYFGEITESAVKDFQKNNKLSADGSVGVQTMSKLTNGAARSKSKHTKTPAAKSSGGNQTENQAVNQMANQDRAQVSGSVQALINAAASKEGAPYVWGAKGPGAFDCSGLIYWALNQVGVNQSYLTSSGWKSIGKYKKITNYNDIIPGDIIVENGHMGIAAEDGKVVDASSGNGKVMYRKRSTWWKDNFIVAWRIF